MSTPSHSPSHPPSDSSSQSPSPSSVPAAAPPAQSAPTPLFLFSMPRSGSTLLQRMLATHSAVATGPEPTFLLPMLHIGSSSEVFATFDQRYTAMAVEDFLESTPSGRATLDHMVRAAATEAYAHGSDDGARFFLDKTPKYHMVSDDILRIFPDSPAIVLWRNPLAIIASLMSTWGGGGGRWNLHHFRLDLFFALPKLIDSVTANAERVCAIRYEDLVDAPDTTLSRLFGYLGLDDHDSDIEAFGDVHLAGRVQDPNVGKDGFTSVRSDRTQQWATILSNPIRKAWCRRYLNWLGADRMSAMGYDLTETLADLDAVRPSTRWLASDLVLVPYDTIYRVFEVGIFTSKLRSLRHRSRPLLAHK